MRLVWCDDAQGAASEAAGAVARLVRLRPGAVLALPTGDSAIPFYAELARLGREGALSLAAVTTFNLDEYLGLGPGHPQTYRAYMQRHLVARTDVDPARVHLPDGDSNDPAMAAAAYERAIDRAGGIDLAVLGLGANGHVAFNEPGSSWQSRTRAVALTAETRRANARLFGPGEAVPTNALTMGLATIFAARSVVLVAAGQAKAHALSRLLGDERGPELPASRLLDHPDLLVAADRALMPRERREGSRGEGAGAQAAGPAKRR